MDRKPQSRLASQQIILLPLVPSHQDIERIHPLSQAAWYPILNLRSAYRKNQP